MSEIRLDVDLRHPPEAVWRALTEQRLLARWFMLTDLEPVTGTRFQLLPEGLPGFPTAVDGEVTDAVPERRLAMRWQGDQLHSKVTWELTPAAEGCTLAVTQSGFLGVRGSARRRALVSTYKRLFEVRLPAVLDGVSVPPLPRVAGATPAGPDRRRQLLAVGAAALLVALVAALVANLPSETSEPAVAQTGESGGPAAALTTATTAPSTGGPRGTSGPSTGAPIAAPSSAAAPSSSAPTPARTVEGTAAAARYSTVSSGALNYRGAVAVEAANGWTLTITVPILAAVTGVEGPRPSQNGTTVTFAGTGAIRVVFDVALDITLLGPKKPLSCAIDGTPCAGL